MPNPFKHLPGHWKKVKASDDGDSCNQDDSEPNIEPKLQILTFDGSVSLWEQALRTVKQDTGWEPPSEWHVEYLSLPDVVEAVRREAQSRADEAKSSERRIAGSKYTYRQVYDRVARCAKDFQTVGRIVVQAEPVYAALPWAVIEFAITLSVGESETYHRMLESTADMSQFISQYSAIEATYARVDSKLAEELRKLLLSFYVDLLKYQIFAIHYFDSNHKFSRALIGLSPLGAQDIKARRNALDGIRDKVDRAIALVDADVSKRGFDDLQEGQTSIQMDQRDLLKVTKEGIIALSQNTGNAFREQSDKMDQQYKLLSDMWGDRIEKYEKIIKAEEIEKEKQELRNIRAWLSVAQPESNLSDAQTKRHLELGKWLLEDGKFLRWKESRNSSLLWLHGFAGTGKTGLACRAIESLRGKIRHEEYSRFAFFFCSSDKAGAGAADIFSRSDPREALRSLVSQLSIDYNSRAVVSLVQDKYKDLGPDSVNKRGLTEAECIEILVAISHDLPITIVLDAFDELDQERSPALLSLFHEMLKQSPKNIKIFITTRSFSAIENDLASDQSIEVTTENNGEDVRIFIKETLQERIKDRALLNGNVSDGLRADIERILTARAQSMFLYAALLLNQLCGRGHTNDEESIRRKLEELPKDITEMYNGILAEVHDDKNNSERSCRIAQDTFKWLLMAQGPLPTESLLEAISPPESKANLEEVLRDCRTLVNQGTLAFEFAHYTVREHLHKMHQYSQSKCHLTITLSCLNVLNSSFGVETEVRPALQPLLDYALLYWPFHYEGIAKEDIHTHRNSINTGLRNFLLQGRSKTNKYALWLDKAQEMAKKSLDNRHLSTKLKLLEATPPSPLFAACVFGHEELIGKFGRELDGLNKANAHGQTALCLAIESGKLEVVKALLSKRFPAELNLINVKAVEQFENHEGDRRPDLVVYASPLQCAAAVGTLEILEYLIGEGANIDVVAGFYGSPLQAAAANGQANVVSLLLGRGAEPNSQGGHYGNALQAAAANGHVDIISLLLENKPPALISSPGGFYGSALTAAVASGNSDTVWALLEERADPNVKTRNQASLLEHAAGMGNKHAEIVSMLLDSGAQADLSPKSNENEIHILHRAAMYNMIDLARHCLDRGCQIDLITTGGPAYHRRFGDFPAEMSPLGFACAEGHVEMVDLLLNRGAPFEIKRPRAAPLWAAAYQGHAAVVDLLITRFKQNRPQQPVTELFEKRPGPRSGHPLFFAGASSGSPDVVRVLLDHNVEYKPNWYGATPLLATATYAAPLVTQVLLEYHKEGKVDARIDQRQRNGRTALTEAFSKNRGRVARQLLDAGADYTIPDDQNATCLHFSTNHDNPAMVSNLLRVADQDPDRARFMKFLNLRHSSGKTAILDSADRNRPKTIRLLLERGGDFTTPGHAGNTPLHWACGNGHYLPAVELLKNAKAVLNDEDFQAFLNYQNKEGKTPLWSTVSQQRLRLVELLLEYGADPVPADKGGASALHEACYKGFPGIAKTLVHKASINLDRSRFESFLNQRNNGGKTALSDACEQSHVEIARLLLQYKPDLTIPHSGKVTVLHQASFRGLRELTLKILAEAANSLDPDRFAAFLNHRNDKGKTALMDAAETGRHEIVKRLLAYGADWSIVDNNNFTALHYCTARKHGECAKHILETASSPPLRNDDNTTKTTVNGISHERTAIPRQLVTENRMVNGAPPSGKSEQRFQAFLNCQSKGNLATAIRDASMTRLPHIVGLLLPYDPDLELVDKDNRTALHFAVRQNNDDMFVLLVDHIRRRKQIHPDGQKWMERLVVQLKDRETGESVLESVKKGGNRRMVEALRGCGFEIED